MSPDAGQEWRKVGYQGQHEEEGIVLALGGGLRLRTPSIYDVARTLGKSHHDSVVWAEYNAIADRIIADHNAALLLAEAREALGEISSGAFKRMRDSHNQRGSDGPCDCTICRTYDVAAAALVRISGAGKGEG